MTINAQKPSRTYQAHMAAVTAGEVTKTNVIGIRKLLNVVGRMEEGLSTACTDPKVTFQQADELLAAIHEHHPKVAGELHASGIKVLRNPRYAKRWDGHEARIIGALSHFELVDYEERQRNHTPVYRAVSLWGDYFDFLNVPWQSGGNGPEVV